MREVVAEGSGSLVKDPVVILGGDGYIGWPLAVHLARGQDRDVIIFDNLVTRRLVTSVGSDSLSPIETPTRRIEAYERETGRGNLEFVPGDARDPEQLDRVVSKYRPSAIVHLAQQRSAPFSMVDQEHALYTQLSNVATNLNVIFSIMRHSPSTHLLKMGTMGEYGTPNIEITEGPVEIVRKGRKHKAMFPRAPGSWYHLSKVFDTHNVMFANKINGLKATDVMQGVVYGSRTEEISDGPMATRFDFDSIWGTVINKYVVQAVTLGKLLIYGRGMQTRGFLSLYDSIKCLGLLLDNPPDEGEYRVVNQLDETFNTLELAKKVRRIGAGYGIKVEYERVKNPRVESEEHYFKVVHKALPSLGFRRTKRVDDVIREIFETVLANKAKAMEMKALLAPSVTWKGVGAISSDAYKLPRDLTERSSLREVVELAMERQPSSVH